MNLKEKQLAVLEETVNHFNRNNRAVKLIDKKYKCVYSPVEGISEGCAVGRLVKDKSLCDKFDERRLSVTSPHVYNLLPPEIQELGDGFLRDLQNLHDDEHNWNKTGLSSIGKNEYINIKNNING